MTTIDRTRIGELFEAETKQFSAANPKSRSLHERAKDHLLDGVPMNWMTEWPGPYPLFAREATGAYITDVDDHRYVDFCLGDTGAMFGHSPPVVMDAIAERLRHGITYMLPTEDAIRLGEEL